MRFRIHEADTPHSMSSCLEHVGISDSYTPTWRLKRSDTFKVYDRQAGVDEIKDGKVCPFLVRS